MSMVWVFRMSDAGDLAAFARENPHFISGIKVIGLNLRFREAMPEDAEFTLSPGWTRTRIVTSHPLPPTLKHKDSG